jgi:hypothetical protein
MAGYITGTIGASMVLFAQDRTFIKRRIDLKI